MHRHSLSHGTLKSFPINTHLASFLVSSAEKPPLVKKQRKIKNQKLGIEGKGIQRKVDGEGKKEDQSKNQKRNYTSLLRSSLAYSEGSQISISLELTQQQLPQNNASLLNPSSFSKVSSVNKRTQKIAKKQTPISKNSVLYKNPNLISKSVNEVKLAVKPNRKVIFLKTPSVKVIERNQFTPEIRKMGEKTKSFVLPPIIDQQENKKEIGCISHTAKVQGMNLETKENALIVKKYVKNQTAIGVPKLRIKKVNSEQTNLRSSLQKENREKEELNPDLQRKFQIHIDKTFQVEREVRENMLDKTLRLDGFLDLNKLKELAQERHEFLTKMSDKKKDIQLNIID